MTFPAIAPRLFAAIVMAAFSLCFVPAVSANDTAVEGVGGTFARLKGEHNAVRMVRENVRIDMYADYYDTTVDFLFQNETPRAVSVQMGFPESGYVGTMSEKEAGDVLYKTRFRRFSTTVDGKPVKVTRQKGRLQDVGDYLAYWVKTVDFPANGKRQVQVRYRSPYGLVSAGELDRFVNYDFTGGNWRGMVEESRLSVTFHAPGAYAAGALMSTGTKEPKVVPLTQSGSTLTAVWHNWKAEAHFSLLFDNTFEGWLVPEKATVYGAGILSGADLHAITIPGTRQILPNTINNTFLPPAILRDGVVYARANTLGDLLFPGVKEENYPGNFHVGTTEGEKQATVRFSNKDYGSMTLGFVAGKKTVTVGSDTQPLPGAPFILKGRIGNDYPALYIPLKPITDIVKRPLVVDAARHRIDVSGLTQVPSDH